MPAPEKNSPLSLSSNADSSSAACLAVDNVVKAIITLSELTSANPTKCGGKLLLKGTRFSVGQLIAELADDGESLRTVCDNYDLDYDQVVQVLHAIAVGLSSPVA